MGRTWTPAEDAYMRASYATTTPDELMAHLGRSLPSIYQHGGRIEALPENSFKASGTGVNTVIAVIPA